MRFTTIFLAALTLCGCLNVPNPVTLPDGSQGFTIHRCRSMNACYNKAAEICGGQYEALDSSARGYGSVTVVNGIGAGSSGTEFEIMVKCKAK